MLNLIWELKASSIFLEAFWCLSYPKATSKIIITTKPMANIIVPISEWGSPDISGISSSTTTYIIAPAAKLQRYGKIGTIKAIAKIVIIAPIG